MAPSKAAGNAAAKPQSRSQGENWLTVVMATSIPDSTVYDSCPELVQKIKKCLKENPGVTKAAFCRIALQGVQANALSRFMKGKGQDQQGNQVYPRAFVFFEKLRLMNGQPLSKARRKNEEEQGEKGFSTKSECIGRPSMVFYCPEIDRMRYNYQLNYYK